MSAGTAPSPATTGNPDQQVGLVNIAIHGHFYQPERSDPFTGMIPVEGQAAPFANFNERITAECYRPNAELGNFDLISFDLGPTLAAWLEKAHPDVYRRIIEAEARHRQRYGVSNAMAQAYHHPILPLASARDKRTQILWGLSDYRHRFGHDARGMWCPETAVDLETLDIMAQHGITYTILAPWQAANAVDITEPYMVRLKAGRSITVFFYNDLSGAVSYNDDATADANTFAANFRAAYVNQSKWAAGHAQIIPVATDGELYGHHKTGWDQFLKYFLRWSARGQDLEPCSFERYLVAHPATRAVAIHEPSSWSCHHGVSRWSTGCACDGTSTLSQHAWKPALRSALTRFQHEVDQIYEQYGGTLLHDPWAARDDFIALHKGWQAPEAFWQRHARRTDIASIMEVQNLLLAQYSTQCSLTSCGWFFEDLDRIEPRNCIAFARRGISLVWQTTGLDLQRAFVRDLAQAQSWQTGVTGADLYRALAAVPANLLSKDSEVIP